MKQLDRLGILVHLPSTHNYIACMLGLPISHNVREVKKRRTPRDIGHHQLHDVFRKTFLR